MADLNILDYLGYAVLPNMMKMSQDRQKEIDQQRLSGFQSMPKTFDLPQQPGAPAGTHQSEVPGDVRESYKRTYGMPWPQVQRETPVGMSIEHARMRSPDELTLRDAAVKGQSSGIQAGEAELAQRPYIPGATDFKMGQLRDVISATGENPADFSLSETMGLKRRQTSKEDDPKTLENLAARQLQSRDYAGAEQTLKMLKDLKARDHAPAAFNADQQLWQAANGDVNKFIDLKNRIKPGTDQGAKDMQRLEDDIMQVAGRLSSIQSGVNIMDPAMSSERPAVVEQLKAQLNSMVKEYERMGGNPARLGVGGQPGQDGGQSQYKTPDDVKAAFKEGKITRDQAATVLRQQFGMQ